MQELAIAAQAGVPVLVLGKPGVGKTSFVNAFGKALGLPVETVIASIREPSDFAGLPVIMRTASGESRVEFAPPLWAQRLVEAGEGILFFDEIAQAPPAVASALLRVVLDRFVAELELPRAVWVIAAANPPEIGGGWDLSAPLANRFCHLDWRLDSTAWVDGMVQGWPAPVIPVLPKTWEEGIPQARSLVASYIQHQPQNLIVLPENDGQAGKAWPSPRSWEMSARLIAAVKSVHGGEDLTVNLIAGCVGTGVGLEFWQWLKNLDLPDPEALLKNPVSLRLPKRGDIQFAILSSVVAAVVNNLTDARWLAGWSVLEEAVKQGASDVAAAVSRGLIANRKANFPTPVRQANALFAMLQSAGIVRDIR